MSTSGFAASRILRNGFRALAADEIVRILPSGQQRELDALPRLQVGKREMHGAKCRLQPRLVAVEAEDRLVRHLPEHAELVFGQRRAERRDRRLEAGGDAGDHVDIALDDDDVPALPRSGARGLAVVEDVALVEERRLRRVQIFRLRVGARARGRRRR